MLARLVAIEGGTDATISGPLTVVGRHPLCDVRIDSVQISRHHCCIAFDRDDMVVRDLGSTNGIAINGRRVERGRVQPGDELAIAHLRFRYERMVGSSTPPPADPQGPPSSVFLLAATTQVAPTGTSTQTLEQPLRELVAETLGMIPERCQVQVYLRMMEEDQAAAGAAEPRGEH